MVSLHFHQRCGFGIVFSVTQTFEKCRIVQAQQFADSGIGQLRLFVWFVHKRGTFGISQRTLAALIQNTQVIQLGQPDKTFGGIGVFGRFRFCRLEGAMS